MIYECLRNAVGSGATAPQVVEFLKDNVLLEVTGLLGVVIPTVIAFIAFRKGYKFLKSTLRSA